MYFKDIPRALELTGSFGDSPKGPWLNYLRFYCSTHVTVKQGHHEVRVMLAQRHHSFGEIDKIKLLIIEV